MTTLIAVWTRIARVGDALGLWLVPSLARLAFAGVLLGYFMTSVGTKLGPGLTGFLHPTDGAFVQIYPRLTQAAGYDTSQIGLLPHLIVIAGTMAEAVLPILITIGLFTRLAALGMIGFVLLQSLTDVFGHGVTGADLGAWFDAASDALILDQRAFWMLAFVTLITMGGGPLSVDRILSKRLFSGLPRP